MNLFLGGTLARRERRQGWQPGVRSRPAGGWGGRWLRGGELGGQCVWKRIIKGDACLGRLLDTEVKELSWQLNMGDQSSRDEGLVI